MTVIPSRPGCPRADIRREIDKRTITAGTTLVALLYLLTEPTP